MGGRGFSDKKWRRQGKETEGTEKTPRARDSYGFRGMFPQEFILGSIKCLDFQAGLLII